MAPQPQPVNPLAQFGQIIQGVAGQNQVPSFSGLPLGMTSSGVNAAFSPEVLFASGLYSPQQLNAGIEATLQNLLAKYQRDISGGQIPFGATEGYFVYNQKPQYAEGTELGNVIRGAANGIIAGEFTADDAVAKLKKGLDDGTIPATVAPYFSQLAADIKQFGDTELPNYRQNIAKYQYETGGRQADIPMPTRQQAMLEYYNQIGMPQLAVLPDPTAQYQIDPFLFMDKGRFEDLGQRASSAQTAYESELRRLEPQLQKRLGFFNRAVPAIKASNKAYERYIEENRGGKTAGDIARGIGLLGAGAATGAIPGLGIPFLVGGFRNLFGEKKPSAKVIAGAKRKGMEAAKAEMAKTGIQLQDPNLRAQLIGKIAGELSPSAKKARYESILANQAMKMDAMRAQREIEKAQAALTSMGLTPFDQARNQLLMNAAVFSAKKRN